MMSVGVNLLPQRYRLAALRRRRARVWMVIVLLVGVGTAGLAGWSWSRAMGADQVSPAVLGDIERERARLQSRIAVHRKSLATSMAQLDASRAVSGQPNWGDLLRILADVLGEEVALRSLEVSTPMPGEAGQELRMTFAGIIGTQSETTQLVLDLEMLGLFDRVKLVSSSRDTVGPKDVVAFRVECVIEGAEDGA